MRNKILHSEKGFTLVEIMVAAALVGILAMAVISQLQLVGLSKKDSTEALIINRLTDQVAVELSHQETCSLVANFKNLPLTAGATAIPNGSIVAADGVTKILAINQTYGILNGLVSSSVTANMQTVKVTNITTKTNATDTNQIDLEITFNKKTGVAGTFLSGKKVVLPITIIKNAALTQVNFCYSDITNSIASAIRLSCQGNNSYYDPTINLPYGGCKHNIDTANCPAGQYIQKVEIDPTANSGALSGKMTFTCGTLPTCAVAGQVVQKVNLDGSLVCAYPLPNCTAGQLMYKTAAGPYACLSVTACAGTNAVQKIDSATGNVTCNQYFPPSTCPSGRATEYDPSTGAQVCAPETFQAKTCPPGQYISSFDANGLAQCTVYINPNVPCGANRGAIGVDGSGNLICQALMKKWCNGTPSIHTDADCAGIGSLVNGPGPNQVCKVAGSSCPGGWAQCPGWGESNTTSSCSDTSSACTLPLGGQTTPTIGFISGWSAPSVTCTYYYDIPGDGVPGPSSTCGSSAGNSASGPLTAVGCY